MSKNQGSKNQTRGYLMLAILLVAYCVIALAVPFVRTPAYWVAFISGIVAILFQLWIFHQSALSGSSARSRFYGFPIARLGVIYLVIQLVVSFIEMALAKFAPLWIPLVINVLIAALAGIGCITTETMRDEISQQDERLRKNVANMRELQSMSATLLAQCGDGALKPTLQKIADELRYSDPVSSDATRDIESELRTQLGDIQQALVDNDSESASRLCTKLLATLAERNRLCSVNK